MRLWSFNVIKLIFNIKLKRGNKFYYINLIKNLTLTLIQSNQLFNLDLIPQNDEKLYLIQASSLKA